MNDKTLESRILELVRHVSDLPESQRIEFLEDECDEVELREAVQRRLSELADETQTINVAATDAWKPGDRDNGDAAAFGPEKSNSPEIWNEATQPRQNDGEAANVRVTQRETRESTPQLAGYDVQDRIGRGGMGAVYRARHLDTDRTVALKVIRQDRMEHSSPDEQHEAIERFRNEALAAARLDHDGIVTVYDVGEEDGLHYYAMRFVDGKSLAEMVISGPLPPRVAAEYLESAARALHEAHESGVLHRDVKPHNILIDGKSERALVADFGLAKLCEGGSTATRSGEVFGSPPYMSPEQAVDASSVSASSDIYSLGATLYHVITGRPPFQGSNALQTLKMVCEHEPVAPREINTEIDLDLETICLKCLAKDPVRRYHSAREFADDLRRFLHDEPIQARPAGRVERLRKFSRRNKGLVTGLAAAAVSLLIGLVATSIGAVWAMSEANDARLAKGRAEVASQAATRASIESLEQAGDLAAQRGRWRIALDNYNRALSTIRKQTEIAAYVETNRIPLRIKRIHALISLFETKLAREEAEALMADESASEYEGAVLMLMGAAEATRFLSAEKGMPYYRRALATGNLSKADEHYAKAVLAVDVEEGIKHAELALIEEPFRQDAHNLLVLLYGMTGQREKVLKQVSALQKMFPEDPNYVFQEALLLVLDGQAAKADATLLAARDRISDKQLEAARRDVKNLANLVAQLQGTIGGDMNIFGLVNAWRQADKLAVLLGRGEQSTFRLIPLGGVTGYPAMQPLIAGAKNFIVRLLTFQYRAAQNELANLLPQYSIHEIYLLHAKITYRIAKGITDTEKKKVELLLAERSFQAAANLPQFIDAMPPHANIDGLAVQTDLIFWNFLEKGDPLREEIRLHALGNVRALLAIAADPSHRWHHWVMKHAFMVVVGAAATEHFDLAREMTGYWIAEQPASAAAYEWRAVVEQMQENWIAALRAADKAIELDVGKTLTKSANIRALALRKIAKLAEPEITNEAPKDGIKNAGKDPGKQDGGTKPVTPASPAEKKERE